MPGLEIPLPEQPAARPGIPVVFHRGPA
jgi:hypothetical protein